MIKQETFTKEWIEAFRQIAEYKKTDKASIEKMIYALALLEKLAENQFDFIFKGGTALVLLLDKTYRFSIDIDIITKVDRSVLEQILDQIVNNSFFIKWEIDKDRSFTHNLPKAHYILTYRQSHYGLGNTILLDVLFTENLYPEVLDFPLVSHWLSVQEPHLKVRIPSIDSILGDKLTAFAPNTTGIKYGIRKEVEIIKQLFDISNLIERVTNLETVYQSFINTAIKEIEFRNIEINPFNIVEDIFTTALILVKRDKNNTQSEKENFAELQQGIKNMENFQVHRNFKIEQAIEASAKSSWFTQLLITKNFSEFILYQNTFDLDKLLIENMNYNFLNRLKKTNKAAFYYWYKCLELKDLAK